MTERGHRNGGTMSDPDERPRAADDAEVVDWEDFEQMTDRVLALPPQPDDD